MVQRGRAPIIDKPALQSFARWIRTAHPNAYPKKKTSLNSPVAAHSKKFSRAFGEAPSQNDLIPNWSTNLALVFSSAFAQNMTALSKASLRAFSLAFSAL